jgi:amino acid adenylation domain-containing protein
MAEPQNRRQLLFQRLKEKKEASLGASPGSAVPRLGRLGRTSADLSYAQQRLWVLEQLDPGNPRFCVLTALRLRGGVHLGALAAALSEIVRRHEVLRTVFSGGPGGSGGSGGEAPPRQVVAPPPEPQALPVADLAGLPEDRREALLSRLLTAEAQRPFDLANGPLVRTFLLRLGPAEHILVLAQHQITIDRWSRGLTVRELTALYSAFAEGRPSPLPEPALQYIDFSQWQRERLQGKLLDDLVGFWRRQLAGSPRLEMPVDRPRPAVQRFNGALRYSVIPRPLLDRLKAFSQAEEVSLFMTLLAAFDALLYRWTGQEDVVVGSPIANRNQKQVEELMGFFVNMLALRLRLDGSLTFRKLVGRAREVTLDAFAHQDLPFELLVRELGVPRDMSLHPLFQVSLVLQNAPLPPLDLPGLSVGLVEVDWGTTAYDLAFFFWETALWENLEEGLSLIISYSTDLYDAATVARLAGHLERLLAAAMDDPDVRLRDLEILAPAERHQLLAEWSGGTDVPLPAEPLHRLAEARAAQDPEAPAADFAGETVTAAELCRRAHRMARWLRRHGLAAEVAAEAPVALVLPPSLDLVVASLAVLEAGGVCVPIDPELPAGRIDRLLEASRATVVVTGRDLEGAPFAGESAEPLRLPVDPDALAYLLFTSGSTGTPKAVGLPHRAVARMALADPAGPAKLSPEDRVALAANPSFDASLWEIWAPLLAGACLVGLEREALLAPRGLKSALAERRLSVLFVPTALLHTVAGEVPSAFRGLRLLLFGGEMADPAALRAVLAHSRPERLVHLYGPAEATTYAALQEVTDLPPRAAAVPVGRPAPGRRVYVLDPAVSPVPLGVEGEVWIGGEGLARGYAGAPDLTAERFLPDPFSGAPGARLYRTGDRARLRADGALEIRGRTDEQVKVRGFRVEPAEVRAALTRHPGVREAAVAAREGRLEAYAVPRSGARLEPDELLADLRRRLPAWMVPSRLAVVDALPLTASGKVDFRSLPEILPARPAAGPAPRTPVEQALAGIWQDILGRSVTNVQDDFFGLGGQSLDAVRATSRAACAFGVDLTVRALYEAPTVEAFAARLGAK